MAKLNQKAPNTVAKKDNTRVARTRISSELVGDKPNYSKLRAVPDIFSGQTKKLTKEDTARYEYGFREQIMRDKTAGKSTKPYTAFYDQMNQGRHEAQERRQNNDINKKALVRDSSIPLAPTEFPN
ncbi:MAG: hypothetical protein RIR01_2077 [Bacteroidota bacterium]|jgi:hypothetical protein